MIEEKSREFIIFSLKSLIFWLTWNGVFVNVFATKEINFLDALLICACLTFFLKPKMTNLNINYTEKDKTNETESDN